MKKLKCESCGGLLNIEENGEYAYCDYCKTKYKLNEDKTITFKMDENVKHAFDKGLKTMGKVSVLTMIVPIFVFVLACGGIAFGIYKAVSHQMKDDPITINNNFEKESITSTLELYKGTKSSMFVSLAIDEIITYNKKNTNDIITVTYNGEKLKDTSKILELKKSLQNTVKYEILYDYDENGYILNMTIQKY